MPLAQVRALFHGDGVRIEPHEPDRDCAALRSLAAWMQRFSPVAAVDEPDGLMLDVSGCEQALGGEDRIVHEVIERLDRLGIGSRVAIAPTFGSAWAIARFGPDHSTIVLAGEQQKVLASLPVAALRISKETVTELAAIGIERVEHLLDLPRSTLPGRFGEDLLLMLDQALGHAMETIDPVRPVPIPIAERVFEGPTDRVEAIELTVRGLLADISMELHRRESGARLLEITLARSDLPPTILSVTLGHPSRDPKHLWTLVRPKLERAHLGFGVEAVRVRVQSAGRLRHEQIEYAPGGTRSQADTDRAFGELLDTLSNRLGTDRVLRVSTVESHLPERSFEMRPAMAETRQARELAQITLNDRPTVLFEHPLAAEVVALTPDGPVHRIRWREGDEAVISCVGPERIGSEWWRSREKTRDCFRVQCESGRWLWLVRSLDAGRWFVHGVWA